MKYRMPKSVLFLILIAAALLIALCAEIFLFNASSFRHSDFEYENLDLSLITDSHGNYVSEYGDPILIRPNESSRFTLVADELYSETDSVRLTFSGDTEKLEVEVSLRDDASAYAYADAFSGVCVPGSTTLNTLDCPIRSSGYMQSLQITIRLDPALEAEIYLDSIELNPEPLPVRVQPIRLTVSFLLVWFVLFLFLFPWRNIYYQPGNMLHRLALIVPMAGMMVLCVCFYVVSLPPNPDVPMRGLLQPVPVEAAAEDFDDVYAQLFTAFQAGQLHLTTLPSDELLELENPYDASQRQDVDFLFDYAMYNDKYYVYFGTGPLWMAYYPVYLLTGGVPSQQLCGMLLNLMGIPLIFYAVLGIAKKYIKKTPLFLLILSCVAVSIAAAGPFMYTGATRYINVVSGNITTMAGALGFGWHATLKRSSWKRSLYFVLCGLFLALQVTCRANTILITTAALAPAFIAVLLEKGADARRKIKDAACFLVPALISVAAVMWYNFARFGSVVEFGQTHQLTVADVHYYKLRFEQIPEALYHFFFDMPRFYLPFPYVDVSDTLTNLTGNYFFHAGNAGVFSWPLAWPIFLIIPAYKALSRRTKSIAYALESGFTLFAPLVVAAGLMVVTYFYAGLIQRYTYDFLLIFMLAGIYAGLSLCTAQAECEAGDLLPVWQNTFAVFCVLSVLLALLYGFRAKHSSVMLNDPEFFVSLVRMFFPYFS